MRRKCGASTSTAASRVRFAEYEIACLSHLHGLCSIVGKRHKNTSTISTSQSSYSSARQRVGHCFLFVISFSTSSGRVFDGTRGCCIRDMWSSTLTLYSNATGRTAVPKHFVLGASLYLDWIIGVETMRVLKYYWPVQHIAFHRRTEKRSGFSLRHYVVDVSWADVRAFKYYRH